MSANKKRISNFFHDCNTLGSDLSGTEQVLKKYFREDLYARATDPHNETFTLEDHIADFWKPLQWSFHDMEWQPYIMLDGKYGGKDRVCVLGNIIAKFANNWHAIPATSGPAGLRFGAHYIIKDNQVVKAWYFIDTLELIRQAGFSLFPTLGFQQIPPAPMTGDGLDIDDSDPEETQRTLDLTNAMIRGLLEYDSVSIGSMRQEQFWDVKNMMWYGPAGIGTTKGLAEFQQNHQIPFLTGFPDRGVLERPGEEMVQLGQGNYSMHAGFPAMYATHLGDDWLGLKATGTYLTMRVMDFWRREEDRLKENWVLIDMVNVLKQLGVDVFQLLKKEVKTANEEE